MGTVEMHTRFEGRTEGQRPLGRPRHKYNIKWILEKWDWVEGMDWIDLAQDRDRWRALVNAMMNIQFS